MKKKLLTLILAMTMMFAFAGVAMAANSYTYDEKTKTMTITGNYTTGDSSTLNSNIKEECEILIIEDSVTSITVNSPFYDWDSLKTVEIGSGLETMPSSMFKYCSNLETVTLSGDIALNSYAFAGCTNLNTIEGLENITAINSSYNFYNCTSLSGDLVFSDSITSVPEGTFAYCTNINSVKMEGVTDVAVKGFWKCSELTSATFATNGLQTIGWWAFLDCESLTSVGTLNVVSSMGNRAFAGCQMLTGDIDNNVIELLDEYVFYNTGITSFSSTSVTTTNQKSFSECNDLTTVTMPNLETIAAGLFINCTSLTSLEFNEAIGTVGFSAFSGCSNLESITLPQVTALDKGAFANCTELESVELSMVEIIGSTISELNGLDQIATDEANGNIYGVFENCTSLTELSLPSVTLLGYNTFTGCDALATLTLPSSAPTVAYAETLFEGVNCDDLDIILVDEDANVVTGDALVSAKAIYSAQANWSDIEYFANVTDSELNAAVDELVETGVLAAPTIAGMDKEVLASTDSFVDAVNTVDELFVDVNGDLTVEAEADTTQAGDDAVIGDVEVAGLGLAVYGNGTTIEENTTLTLKVEQQTSDEEVDFSFTAKPYVTVGTGDSASTTEISNEDLNTPVTFTVTLPESFDADYVIVKHVFSDDSGSETLTCKVMTASDDDSKYITITVTEFSTFEVTGYKYSVSYTYYDITLTTTGEGTITPTGGDNATIITAKGGSRMFTFTPADGYVVDDVIVDGTSVGAVETYYFSSISADHTLEVVFVTEDGSVDTSLDAMDEDAYYYNAILWAIEEGMIVADDEDLDTILGGSTRAESVYFMWVAYGSPIVDIENPFTDIDTDDYYYNAVLWAYSEDITAGTTDTTFSPNDVCTRAQIASFIHRAEGEPTVESDNDFTDLTEGAYYVNAINWAVSEEIVAGMTTSTFEPNTDCARTHILTFLYRYCV